MGTWTLARWQRLMAALGVFAGAALNVAVLVFHLGITGEGSQAVVVLVGAGGVVLGFILFAGDSTSNAQVAALADVHYDQLAKHEALAYDEGRQSVSGRPKAAHDYQGDL